jgi:heme exporter protein A
MLEVANLACRRGDRMLFSGLSFSLEAGTLLHVRGRNGCGKTTLLRTLCGLLTPDAGAILWNGEKVRRLGEEFHRDTLYFGHLNGIKSDLTACENLRVAAILDGDEATETAILAALDEMGLEGREDLPTKVLSQGQKKRVALARLLLSRAPLWILDEPFTALDLDAVDRLQLLIAEHVAQDGLVILTTHQELPLTSGQIRRLHLGTPVEGPADSSGDAREDRQGDRRKSPEDEADETPTSFGLGRMGWSLSGHAGHGAGDIRHAPPSPAGAKAGGKS